MNRAACIALIYLLNWIVANPAQGETVTAPSEPGLVKQQIDRLVQMGRRIGAARLRSDKTGDQESSRPPKIATAITIGQTYPVNDPFGDVYLIAKALRKLDENSPDPRKLAKRIYQVHIPVPRTKEDKFYKVDLTVTAPRDVIGYNANRQPVVIVKAGQKVNPLSKTPFPWHMWFLDEQDDNLFAEAAKDPMALIMVTNGDMLKIWRKHRGIRLFKATDKMLKRLVVRSVPAEMHKCPDADLMCVHLIKNRAQANVGATQTN